MDRIEWTHRAFHDISGQHLARIFNSIIRYTAKQTSHMMRCTVAL
jgi:hypothetical protein